MSTTPDAPPPVDEQLRRSVETFYRVVDRLGLPAVSEACALMQLDRLVRRYPAAARESLRLLERGRRAGSGRAGRSSCVLDRARCGSRHRAPLVWTTSSVFGHECATAHCPAPAGGWLRMMEISSGRRARLGCETAQRWPARSRRL